MERLHKLLFELASAERINILQDLQLHRIKLSDISRRLGMTVTETSRHLQRLTDAKLVAKGTDGLYGLTPYGEMVLSQMSGLAFIEKRRDYFLEYDVSSLPYEFISRIGELAEGEVIIESFRALEKTERVLKEAEEFVWVLSDTNFTLLARSVLDKLKASFDLRIILPEGGFPHNSKAVIQSTMPGVQERVLPTVGIRVVVTEKRAGFSLPLRSNKLSYRAFEGESPKFYKWCKDLFFYYWEKAKPITSEKT